MESWPFADPPNLAVITVRQVVRDGQPILWVSHDEDDGWQFLTGGPADEADAIVVSLESMLRRDAALAELADLPLDWRAWRGKAGEPWQRGRQ